MGNWNSRWMFDEGNSICYWWNRTTKQRWIWRNSRIRLKPRVSSSWPRSPSLVSNVYEHHWYLSQWRARRTNTTVDSKETNHSFVPWWNRSCMYMDSWPLEEKKCPDILEREDPSYHQTRWEWPWLSHQWCPPDWYTVQYWRIHDDSTLETDCPTSRICRGRNTMQSV